LIEFLQSVCLVQKQQVLELQKREIQYKQQCELIRQLNTLGNENKRLNQELIRLRTTISNAETRNLDGSPTPTRSSIRPDSAHSRLSLRRFQRFDLPSHKRVELERPNTLSSVGRRPLTGSFIPQRLRQSISHRPGTTSTGTMKPANFYSPYGRSSRTRI
jgi:hypothetical protein